MIPYRLNRNLAPDSEANFDDVVIVKKALASAGYMDPDKDDLGPLPSRALFEGIRKFQHVNGLSVDGVMKAGGVTETSMQGLLEKSPRYKCVQCGAWHGGVFSPSVCADCWEKGYR